MASVVMQTQAFFTLLLARPLLGERGTPWQWLGLGVALAGLFLGEAPTPAQWLGTVGVLFGLLVNQFGARLATWLRHARRQPA